MDVLQFSSIFETKAYKRLLNDRAKNREHSQHFPQQRRQAEGPTLTETCVLL